MSGDDPDGRSPMSIPTSTAPTRSPGARSATSAIRLAVAAPCRQLAEEKQLSIRRLVIETTARTAFVGTPAHVPQLTPHGLDDFVAGSGWS